MGHAVQPHETREGRNTDGDVASIKPLAIKEPAEQRKENAERNAANDKIRHVHENAPQNTR